MNKLLKPYTIVPSNLYVERSADRQVKNILEDMGRPGYVLVSRQMGKTNLLINARRKYANDNDRFVYVDLSNLFDNETQCFRNIIDTAIETNLDVFSQQEVEIREFREINGSLPSHKQHERELRMLLNSIKGKLIIILDEIDALTKVEYSDRIFAQIRSIYFARTNYDEFNRLSYLLSGVVEPSELIKDPKISPFNIGEKIFLNDFSRDEFNTFLTKAGLNSLDEKIKDRVFYWTNGNPRLTWDLCCIIEDQSDIVVNELDIDSLVKLHYLTSFDKPPIDNIREIVKKDSQIQDALVEIEYGKGDVISDNIKQKLYLSGIINYIENDIKIKNRIIKESLSSQWIDSIRELDENLLDKGIEFFDEKNYKQTIKLLESYLSQNSDENKSENFNICHLHLGISYYFENLFDNAITSLNEVDFDSKQYGKLFSKTELYKGYAYQNKRDYLNAQISFEKIINVGLKDEFYLSAKINLGLVLLIGETIDINITKSEYIFTEIADSKIADYHKVDISLFNESKTIALFYLGSNQKNITFLLQALDISPVEYKPAIIFDLYKNEIEHPKQIAFLKTIANLIIENNLKPTKKLEYKRINFDYRLLREIELESFKISEFTTFESLINYEKLKIERYNDELIILDKLIGVAQELNYPLDFVFSLTEYLYNKCEDKNSMIYRNSLKLLVTLNFDAGLRYGLEYIKIVDNSINYKIDITDIAIYMHLIQNALNKNDLNLVFELNKIGEKLKLKLSDELKTSILIFDFFKMKYQVKNGNVFEASQLASTILNELKSKENDYAKNHLIRQMGIDNIAEFSKNTITRLRKRLPIILPKKNGRNDLVKVKYRNGEEIVAKYKKIESDLNNGFCIIIN